MSALGAAAITAGGAVLGTAGSAVAQGKLNRKTRKWNEKMWHMQNEYNLPSAQMERFRQAGLNPHLIYSQGNAGNASSAPAWNPDAPDMSGIGGALGKYFRTRIEQGQIERQKLENAILATDLESKEIDLDVKNQLKNVMVPTEAHIDENGQIVYGTNLETRNMHYEREFSKIQRDIASGDREFVASLMDRKMVDTRISMESQRLINEAVREGLIKAHTAQSITSRELMELDKVIRKYETDFLQNFDLRHGDVSRMLIQLIPMLLNGLIIRR